MAAGPPGESVNQPAASAHDGLIISLPDHTSLPNRPATRITVVQFSTTRALLGPTALAPAMTSFISSFPEIQWLALPNPQSAGLLAMERGRAAGLIERRRLSNAEYHFILPDIVDGEAARSCRCVRLQSARRHEAENDPGQALDGRHGVQGDAARRGVALNAYRL